MFQFDISIFDKRIAQEPYSLVTALFQIAIFSISRHRTEIKMAFLEYWDQTPRNTHFYSKYEFKNLSLYDPGLTRPFFVSIWKFTAIAFYNWVGLGLFWFLWFFWICINSLGLDEHEVSISLSKMLVRGYLRSTCFSKELYDAARGVILIKWRDHKYQD